MEKELTRILYDLDQGNINCDEAEKKVLHLFSPAHDKPTIREKNNLPLEVRYAFCETIEMYHNIISYEMGIIDRQAFISKTVEIKEKYKAM